MGKYTTFERTALETTLSLLRFCKAFYFKEFNTFEKTNSTLCSILLSTKN